MYCPSCTDRIKDDMEYMDCACCEERFHLWCVSEEGEDGPLCKDCGITCDQCDMIILRHDSAHAHTEFVTMRGTNNHTHTPRQPHDAHTNSRPISKYPSRTIHRTKQFPETLQVSQTCD